MPTRVKLPDGTIGEFPDGMSEADIEGVLQKQYGGSVAPKPVDQMSANLNPPKSSSWLNDLESDMRSGGGRTFVGRGLGELQGRGDKGYTGLNSGGQASTADTIASPILGPIKLAQGERDSTNALLGGHPLDFAKGQLKSIGGALETASLPLGFIGGSEGGELIDSLPTKANAGRLFQEVSQAAGDTPVSLTRSMEPLERAMQLSERGAPSVTPADKLFARVNQTTPIGYDEARDFASNLSGLSASDKMAMNPSMQRQVGLLSKAFNADVGDAAAAAGKGPEYAKAMQDYDLASKIATFGKNAGKAAIGASALGGAYHELKPIFGR